MNKFILLLMAVIHFGACQQRKDTVAKKVNSPSAHFSIKDSLDLIILTVSDPFTGSSFNEKYVLYPRGSNVPQIKATHHIAVPVNSVSINSTTHLGFLSELDLLSHITAASNLDLYYNENFQKLIKNGKISSLGRQELNVEQLIVEKTDVFFTYLIDGGDLKKLENLRGLRINSIPIAEYMEQDPLIKASWIKFFACFFGEQVRQKADSIYAEIEKEYSVVKDEISTSSFISTAMTGLPWKGTWFVSGGLSYQAKLIEDAGGIYLWKKYSSEGSIPLDIEEAYLNAEKADVWINPGAALSKKEILANNKDFASFKAFRKDKVYTNYKRSKLTGANDFWESGAVRPDLILKDLRLILSNNSVADSMLYYYKKIES